MILITGGTGFVGQAIALALVEAGHRVRVLARDRARAAARFPPRTVDLVEGEILRAADLAHALEAVEAVVHAAATYSYQRRDAQRMVEENPRLSERVFSLAKSAGVAHVVDISSGIVFRSRRHGRREAVTDASSPLWDAGDREWGGPYLRSKVLAEHVARRYLASGLPLSSIHPVNVIGPEDRGPGTSGAALRRLLQGGAPLPAASSAWVDVRDVAAAVVAVLGRRPGGRYLLAAHWEPWRETAQRLDRLTGRSRRRIWLPHPVVRAVAAINERAGGRLSRDVPTPAELEFVLTLGRVDGSRGLPPLGLGYRDFDTSLRDTLEWWARNGIIAPHEVGGPAKGLGGEG